MSEAMSCLYRPVCCILKSWQNSPTLSVGMPHFCILLSAEALAAVAGAMASQPEWTACLKAARPSSVTNGFQEALHEVANTNLLQSDQVAKLRCVFDDGEVTAQGKAPVAYETTPWPVCGGTCCIQAELVFLSESAPLYKSSACRS